MGDRLRVLLVDDDELFRSFVRHMLRVSEVDVDEAGTLAEGRAKLERSTYDAVLLDLHLPDGMGLSLLESTEKNEKSPAIVMLTSDDDERTARRALRCGAEEYVIKTSLSRRLLVRVLEHSIERARHRRPSLPAPSTEELLQLAGGIAHQVSNPAAFVQSNLRMLVQHIDALERMVDQLSSLNPEDRRAVDPLLERNDASTRLAELRTLLADNEDGMRRITSVVKELRAMAGLDAATLSVPPPQRVFPAPSEPERRRKRVLLIDDEPALLRAYQRILRQEYDTVTAAGGAEALEVLAVDADFDAIVCDVVMPDVDGTAVLLAIEKNHPELCEKFLFCTGGVFTASARDLVVRASAEILEKPVEEHQLHEALARITRRERRTEEDPSPPARRSAPRTTVDV